MKFLFSCNCAFQIWTKWQVTHITGCNYVTVSFIHMFHHKYKAGCVFWQTGVQLRDKSFLLAVSLSLFSFCAAVNEVKLWAPPPHPFFFQSNFSCNSWRLKEHSETPGTIKNLQTLWRYKCVYKTSGSLVAFLGLSGFVWLFIFNLLNSHLHNWGYFFFFFRTFKITGCSICKLPCKLLFFGRYVQRWGLQLCQ